MKIKRTGAIILSCVLWGGGTLGQNLYVSDLSTIAYDPNENAGTIYEFTPDGARRVYASGFTRPLAIAFDGAGNLFVGDLIRRAIFKIEPNGRRTSFASPVSPYGLAVDSAGNVYMTGAANFEFETDIWKFSPDGTSTSFAKGMRYPGPLTFNVEGNLWEVDNFYEVTGPGDGYYDVRIFKHSPTGEQTLFKSGLSYGSDLAIDPQGGLFFARPGGYNAPQFGYILKFGSDANSTTFVSEMAPQALAMHESGDLFVADGGTGEIDRFAPNGSRSTFAPGLTNPTSMAFAPVPRVQVSRTGGEVTVSWPKFASGYTLEGTTVLPANDWARVDRPADALSVTIPVTETSGFFRLRR